MMEGFNLDPNQLVNALSRDNDGFAGGNNGLLWIFLLLLFGGFDGGFGGRRGADDAAITGQVEAALAKVQAAGASEQTILTAIAGNKESVNQLGSYLGVEVAQIQGALSGLSTGLCELGYKMGTDTASVIAQITNGNAAMSRQLADCCCATQRAIDGVNYNMATGFGSLQNNMDKGFCAISHEIDRKIDVAQMENRAGFQGIRDMFTTDKIATLQRELEVSQFQNSQQAQTQVLKDYYASFFNCPPGFVYSKPACPNS